MDMRRLDHIIDCWINGHLFHRGACILCGLDRHKAGFTLSKRDEIKD